MADSVNPSARTSRAKSPRKGGSKAKGSASALAKVRTNSVVELDEARALSVWDDPRTCPRFSVEVGHRWRHLVGIVEHTEVPTFDNEGNQTGTEMAREVVLSVPCYVAERHVARGGADHRLRTSKRVVRYVDLSICPDPANVPMDVVRAASRELVLDADDWKDFTWLDDLPTPIVWNDSAQSKARLKEMFRRLATVAGSRERVVRTHGESGWQREGDAFVYVTGTGAIGASGRVETSAGLSGRFAQRYRGFDLPDPATLRLTREHVVAALRFGGDGGMDQSYAAPLLGAALWAPVAGYRVGDDLDTHSGLSVVLGGPSGSGKTLATSACLGYFAGGFDLARPVGVSGAEKDSTTVGLSHFMGHMLGLPAVIDDVNPPETTADRGARKLAEVVRSAFNGAEATKGTKTGDVAPSRRYRATAFISTEDAILSDSVRNRCVYLGFRSDTQMSDAFAAWAIETAQARREFMALFVQRLAGDRLAVADWATEVVPRLASVLMTAVPQGHALSQSARRVAEQMAKTLTGYLAALHFVHETGVVDEASLWAEWANHWHATCAAFMRQLDSFEGGSTSSRVRDAVVTAFMSGQAHIVSTYSGEPTDSEHLGWHKTGSDRVPRGAMLGWREGDTVYLSATATTAVVHRVSVDLGTVVTESADAIGKLLAEAGVLGKTDKGHTTARVRVGTSQRRGWPVSMAWLLGHEGEDGDGGSEWGTPPMPPLDHLPVLPLGGVCTLPTPEPVSEPEPMPEPVSEPEPMPEPTPEPVQRRKVRKVSAVTVEADEIRETLAWAKTAGVHLDAATATAAAERFREVTGFGWHGTHGTIRAVLSGFYKQGGSRKPTWTAEGDAPVNLGLLDTEVKARGSIWTQRSWMVTPGELDEASEVVGVDVNSQFVAAAGSVRLGVGEPMHWEPGEDMPDIPWNKLAGWVRLASTVEDAPHGLILTEGMWVPTPMVCYLVRDRGLTLDIHEAVLWTETREAMKGLSRRMSTWIKDLRADVTPEGAIALRMLKATYTRLLGGYLASDKGIAPDEWQRPDYAMLLKAQAEANALRNIDKLPEGCVPRAKYADAFYVEIQDGVDLSTWESLDDAMPGRFKVMGPAFSALEFAECTTPDAWRSTLVSLIEGDDD